MNEFTIGQKVVSKAGPVTHIGMIVSFYKNGSYTSEPSDLVVIAAADKPFIGAPHPIIHTSLIVDYVKSTSTSLPA